MSSSQVYPQGEKVEHSAGEIPSHVKEEVSLTPPTRRQASSQPLQSLKGWRNAFYKIQRALRIRIKKSTSSEMFMSVRSSMGESYKNIFSVPEILTQLL